MKLSATFDNPSNPNLQDEYDVYKEGFNKGWRIGMEFYAGSGMLGEETYNEDYIKESFDHFINKK